MPNFPYKNAFLPKIRDFRAFDAPTSGLNAALGTRVLRRGRALHASTHVPNFKSIEARLLYDAPLVSVFYRALSGNRGRNPIEIPPRNPRGH